ncbi:MAG: RNA polymerase sigma factor [Candidatus Krumholzibacteriia bacterium]
MNGPLRPASAQNIAVPDRVGEPPPDPALADAGDIARFLAGDQAGYEALVQRYWRRAYGVALGLAGSGDDAMDATQKAFLRVWKALPRFREGDPFYPWLYRIVRNSALNQRRDEKRHRGDVPLEFVNRPDGRPSPLDDVEGEELRRRLWREIQTLPVEQREALVLHRFQGLKYREIAAVLDIPIGTVMSRLHAARSRLARRLEAEGGA